MLGSLQKSNMWICYYKKVTSDTQPPTVCAMYQPTQDRLNHSKPSPWILTILLAPGFSVAKKAVTKCEYLLSLIKIGPSTYSRVLVCINESGFEVERLQPLRTLFLSKNQSWGEACFLCVIVWAFTSPKTALREISCTS